MQNISLILATLINYYMYIYGLYIPILGAFRSRSNDGLLFIYVKRKLKGARTKDASVCVSYVCMYVTCNANLLAFQLSELYEVLLKAKRKHEKKATEMNLEKVKHN